MSNRVDRRAFAFNIPSDEAEALVAEAAKLNVSITMLLRMWIREVLMAKPIKLTVKIR